MRHVSLLLALMIAALTLVPDLVAQQDPRLENLKAEAEQMIQGRAKLAQEIVDHLFSFGELGMQEFETQRYLTGLLEKKVLILNWE